jgi:hypothetical protein
MTIAVIFLPQRYQVVNQSSALDASAKLLSFAISMPFGLILGSILSGRLRLPFVATFVLGATLQTVGFALVSTVPNTVDFWTGQHAYNVIAGLGTGVSAGTYFVLVPIAGDINDQRMYSLVCFLLSFPSSLCLSLFTLSNVILSFHI